MTKLKWVVALFVLLLTLVVVVNAQSVSVSFGSVFQTMDGFGASETYLPGQSDATMDALFSNGSGQIGLTIMRVGISTSGGTMGTYSNVTKAAARGVRVIALPWSAPGSWKDSGVTEGGHLLTNRYEDWSDRLAAAQATFIANTTGFTGFYAMSVQSEPEFETMAFDSMPYTTAEYVNFWKVWAPKIAALSPRPRMIGGDTGVWSAASSYSDALLADGTAAPYLDLVGGHMYDGMYPFTGGWTGHRWMTEVSTFDTYDGTIANGLGVALQIHNALVTGLASAWCYWWMNQPNYFDNESLYDSTRGAPKRFYVLGQWSKFVRPDAQRVAVSGAPSNVEITAFKNAGGGDVVIVVVNHSGSSVDLTVNTTGLTLSTLTPYVTSASQNIVALSPVTVTSGSFTATVADSSVTSFVGTPAAEPTTRYRFRFFF